MPCLPDHSPPRRRPLHQRSRLTLQTKNILLQSPGGEEVITGKTRVIGKARARSRLRSQLGVVLGLARARG